MNDSAMISSMEDAPSMRTAITQHPVYGPQMTNALRALPSIALATLSTTIDYAPELPASVREAVREQAVYRWNLRATPAVSWLPPPP